MKRNLTELVFILDRSGSMSGLEDDTIGGYNSMLKNQMKEPGDAYVTTVLFDDRFEALHDRENIKNVELMTEKEYYVRGCTALLDAIGITIHKIGKAIANSPEYERPSKVMFVIITDGMENASTEYTYTRVNRMIERQRNKYSWEFIFLGANINAEETAGKMGINKSRASNYHADKVGVSLNYEVLNCMISEYRKNDKIDDDWNSEIDSDFKQRESRRR